MIKIVRTICVFTQSPGQETIFRLKQLAKIVSDLGYLVQTTRVCSNNSQELFTLDNQLDGSTFLSLGSLSFSEAKDHLSSFLSAKNVAFNQDLTSEQLTKNHVEILTQIIKQNPRKTFSYTHTFNNPPSSPYFPSAKYQQDGFSVGLQPTDLSVGCKTLEEWFEQMKIAWNEIDEAFAQEDGYLGIDSSIAPLFQGESSFLDFINRLGMSLCQAATTDVFLRITKFIKNECPRPIGLCGLMFPCLEDFELANEYEVGEFTIERNIFLSLHSGLGIDTYPVGIDEKPERILEILKLVQGLSHKYHKPLSVRFVSDGKAKIGDKTHFQNQYLKDVVIRKL